MLMLGGAVGNMVDRFFTGYVVDMFEVLLFRFAIFNVADVALTLGAVLLGIIPTMDAQGMEREKAWRYNRGSGMQAWETARAGRTCCWRLLRG